MTDEAPTSCPYCDQRFAREQWQALHLGLEHDGKLTPAEREAVETARDEEEADLRTFRLKALAALVFLYFGFLFAYSLFA
ncbi:MULTISPECIES: C2H2-type zinc finger protein [unclassified Haladaptatus]|uniref:DUF7410 domain-containing protein n=1 Tax=unclassified Haladaptatus TaxID=2622732 RepID=UPI0023E8AFFB|nr:MULTISPECIES: C2H2-type zinc finger protein [unclassified Haladaptatus]